MTGSARLRRAPALFVAALVVALVAPLVTATQAPAEAATFRAGMIISDAEFYNSGSMTTAQVQTFLNQRAPNCVPAGNGVPCLKNFRQSTPNRAATARCKAYSGAANETAAAIIRKVGAACGINPKVLLVLLQKEQSLVTSSGNALTPRKYQIATGFGCPDTAACDDQYYGFFNQLYNASAQFKRYAQNPYGYAHVAGRTQAVRLHPNAACGSVSVRIENQATASLYNYTPYTPNGALLNGRPDGCSSYGNFNFAKFYDDWFGRPNFPVIGAIAGVWQNNQNLLGQPTAVEKTGLTKGGVMQQFEKGTIYWSPATSAQMVRGGVGTYWGGQGWERGRLGYPVSAEKSLVRSGVVQTFQGGHVYWSPAGGPQTVLGAMVGRWSAMGWERGVLGFPVSAERALRSGGAVQSFEGGPIYYHPAYGAHAIRGGILQWWAARGWENGMGFPTVSERGGLRAGGSVQSFERGAIYWTPMHGTRAVNGAILTWWGHNGWENGRLGYPVSDETVSGVLVYQNFEGGRITFDTRNGAITVSYR